MPDCPIAVKAVPTKRTIFAHFGVSAISVVPTDFTVLTIPIFAFSNVIINFLYGF